MTDKSIPIPFPPHRELTLAARESLKNNWGLGALATLVYMGIAVVAGIIPFGSVLVSGPLTIGVITFAFKIARNQHAEVGDMFIKSDQLGNAIGAYVLMSIFIFLGFLALIIPGFIVVFGLSQTFYLMAEDKNLGPMQAIEKSWHLMKGYKWDYFIFCLRFIPWMILSVFTLGIGLFFLLPYMYVSFANYYRELVGEGDDDVFDPIDHLIEY